MARKEEELENEVPEDEQIDVKVEGEGEDASDEGEAVELEPELKDVKPKKKQEAKEKVKEADRDGEGDEDDDDDEEDEGPTEEELAKIRAKRRREKQERKERQQRAMERDKIEMDFLRKRNEDLEKRMMQQEMRAHRQDHYTVEQKIAEAEREARLAEEVMAKAIAESNGDDAAKALRFRDEALDKIRALSGERETLKKTEEVVKTPKNVADPVVNSYAKQWISKNPWYDINGGDEDSRIVLEIDNRLANEGYVPRTELYWKELDKRVRRNLPHRFESDSDLRDDENESPSRGAKRPANPRSGQNDSGDDSDAAQPVRGAKKGPPTGQSRELAPNHGRKEVYISKERKEALIAAGVWDDPVLRTRYVKRYQQWDKENATR